MNLNMNNMEFEINSPSSMEDSKYIACRGQKSEVRSQKSEVRSQKSEVGCRKSAVGCLRSAVGSQIAYRIFPAAKTNNRFLQELHGISNTKSQITKFNYQITNHKNQISKC